MMKSCYHKIFLLGERPTDVRFEYFGNASVSGKKVQDSLEDCEKTYQEKLKKVQEEYDTKLKIISEKLEKSLSRWFEDMQQQIPGFLLKLLNLIIPNINITAENLEALILPLLEKTSDDTKLILHFSKDDHGIIESLKLKFKDQQQIIWTVDSILKSGDVVLETSSGTLDNRLQSRIKSLKERWAHHSV